MAHHSAVRKYILSYLWGCRQNSRFRWMHACSPPLTRASACWPAGTLRGLLQAPAAQQRAAAAPSAPVIRLQLSANLVSAPANLCQPSPEQCQMGDPGLTLLRDCHRFGNACARGSLLFPDSCSIGRAQSFRSCKLAARVQGHQHNSIQAHTEVRKQAAQKQHRNGHSEAAVG